MREHLRSALVGSAQGLGATLAGAPWWAVMMLAFGVTVLTYLIVHVLAPQPEDQARPDATDHLGGGGTSRGASRHS